MNILITGASRGIGYAIVKLLGKTGNHKVLAFSRNTDTLTAFKNTLPTNQQARLFIKKFDLINFDEKTLSSSIQETIGSIDILINNAGLLINKEFAQLTEADWAATFQTNFFGPIKLIKTLLPFFNTETGAHIVNIGSMGGFQGSSKFPGLSAYSSSKAALANLTECLAEEFKEKNIRANCLCLGSVDTEMLQEAFPGFKAPVSSDEMAEFILNFATTAHRFINGKVVPVSISTP